MFVGLLKRACPLMAVGSLAIGCGGVYQPSRAAGFETDPAAEITDDDVKKAFEARPQLGEELHVAYYTFDPERAKDVEELLSGLPSVASVYRIPPLIVTGQRRFDSSSPYYYGQQPKEVSIKKLRLLAARARAEVLVIVDHGYKTGGANPLAALDALILPIFFVPFLDNRVEGYVEAFVIDTRNGYLYGHITEDDKRGDEYATIYAKTTGTVAAEQWETLRKKLRDDLGRLLEDERKRSKASHASAASIAPPGSTAPAAPSARPTPVGPRP